MNSDLLFRANANKLSIKCLLRYAWILGAYCLLLLSPVKTSAQDAYDLYLVSVPEDKKIATIQAMSKIIPGIKPAEILSIFNSMPVALLEGANRFECEAAAKRLEQAGAKVQVVGSQSNMQQNVVRGSAGNYSVFLVSVPEDQKVAAIRVIAEIIPGIRPLEIVELLKSLPVPILNGVSKEESEAALKKLQAAGLKAEVNMSGANIPNITASHSSGLYNVSITYFPSNKRIPIIGVIKELKPGTPLETVVNLTKNLPITVLEGVSKAECDAAVKKLEEAGATVEAKMVASAVQAASPSKITGNIDVIITSVPTEKRISVIKAISDLKPGIALEEALELLKKLPVTVLQGITKAESDLAETILLNAGAKVEIKKIEPAAQAADSKGNKTVDVILVSVPTEKQIAVLNAITGLKPSTTLEEVVDLLKKLPAPILKDITKAESEVAAQILEASGAKVEITDKGLSTPSIQNAKPLPENPVVKNKLTSKSEEKKTLPIKSIFPLVPELGKIQFRTPIDTVRKIMGDPTVEMSLQGKMSFTYRTKSTAIFCDEKGVCEMSVWFATDCGYVVIPYTKKALGQFSKSSLRSDVMQVFGDPDDIQPYMGGKQQEFTYYYSYVSESIPILTVKFIIAPNDTLSGIIILNSR